MAAFIAALIAVLILVPGVFGLGAGLSDRTIRPWVLVPMVLILLLVLLSFIAAKSSNPGQNDAAYWGLFGMILLGLVWAEVTGVVAGMVWLRRHRKPQSAAVRDAQERTRWSAMRPYLLALLVSIAVLVVPGLLSTPPIPTVVFLVVAAGLGWWYRRQGSQ